MASSLLGGDALLVHRGRAVQHMCTVKKNWPPGATQAEANGAQCQETSKNCPKIKTLLLTKSLTSVSFEGEEFQTSKEHFSDKKCQNPPIVHQY